MPGREHSQFIIWSSSAQSKEAFLQSPAQKIDALRCCCIYRKLQDNSFTRWLVALTSYLHSSNPWRLFFPVGPVKSNQLRWCSGRKNSSPIQRQGSRKNYPWGFLEVFNIFSLSRWRGVWEVPAHRAGAPLAMAKGHLGPSTKVTMSLSCPDLFQPPDV